MENMEAVRLLVACQALAAKLALNGLSFELNKKQLKALEGFVKVEKANLLGDYRVREGSGLSIIDVKNLALKARQQFL